VFGIKLPISSGGGFVGLS